MENEAMEHALFPSLSFSHHDFLLLIQICKATFHSRAFPCDIFSPQKAFLPFSLIKYLLYCSSLLGLP